MKMKHVNFLVLKPLFLCLALLHAVSCWDGLNDLLDDNIKNPAVAEIKFTDSSVSAGGFSINWVDPAPDTGYGYIIAEYTPGDKIRLDKGETNFAVTGLSSSTEYTVTVKAFGKEGHFKAESSVKVTPSGAYTLRFVYTADELDAVRNNPGDYYILMNDIDLSGYSNWTPVGTGGTPFTGILDGQGFEISNLSIDDNTLLAIGLIGVTNTAAKIKNCTLEGQVTGRYNVIDPCVGGLVGNNAGIIINCFSSVSVTGTINRSKTGGLAGYNSGTISSCNSAGAVKGTGDNSQTGGVVGYNTSSGVITSCSSSGGITGTGAYYTLGGLAGTNNGTITNCSVTGNSNATGSGSGASSVGGLVGYNVDLNSKITGCYSAGEVAGTLPDCRYGGLVGLNYGPVTDCYAGGKITITSASGAYTGGLIGLNINATIKNSYAKGVIVSTGTRGCLVGVNSSGIYTFCYYDSETTGQPDNGVGYPRTTNQMKLIDTSVTTYSGWDFSTVWAISSDVNGGYPYLRDVAP